jgi:uncharacterized protein involved in exopolysaccharide biosynthesis
MQINIIEYLKLLAKYRKLLINNLVIILAIAVIASLIWPHKYKAISSFIPSFNVQTPFSELRETETPDLFSLLGGRMLTYEIYVGIMKSRTVMEDVVNKNGLKYVFKRKLAEEAIKDLEKNSSIEVGEDRIITLTVFMPDPNLAARVANAWVSSFDSLSQLVIKKQGYRQATFIRDRLNDIEHQLDSLSDSLAAFESKYRVFSLDDASNAAINVYAELAVQLLQKEIELMKWSNAGKNIPMCRSIESEIENIRKKLLELENNWRAGVIASVPFSKLPWLQFEHANLARKKNVLDSLNSYLLLEYEIANLKASANTPTIVVIDEAIPSEKRAWPARAKIVLFSTLFAVIFNMILVLALENLKLKWKL